MIHVRIGVVKLEGVANYTQKHLMRRLLTFELPYPVPVRPMGCTGIPPEPQSCLSLTKKRPVVYIESNKGLECLTKSRFGSALIVLAKFAAVDRG